MRHLFRRALRCLVLLAAAGWGAAEARADVIVVPNANTNAEGNSNIFGGTNSRIQQVFAASQFSSAGGPILITRIAFRPDGLFGSAFTTNNPGLQLSLSTTAAGPDGLSLTFAANVGADNTVVRSGPATYGSAATGPAGGPKDFDIVITFTTPFLYDPAGGNLLLDISSVGQFAPESFDAQNTPGDSVSLIFFSGNINSPTGSPFSSLGFVTQFTYTPAVAAVPEPATLVLLGTGLAGVLGAARRRRQAGP